jgi:hypothetical protein
MEKPKISSFTKGEWYTYPNGVGCDGFAIVVTPIGRLIAPDEEKANAHLIAAAPEMYNVLQDIVDLRIDDECTINIKAIKQLLAKARGE